LHFFKSSTELQSYLSEKARIYELGIDEFLIGVNDLSGDYLFAKVKDGSVDSLL
jgi:hypothetical protein